jgi:hypothetical protein
MSGIVANEPLHSAGPLTLTLSRGGRGDYVALRALGAGKFTINFIVKRPFQLGIAANSAIYRLKPITTSMPKLNKVFSQKL